MEHAYYPYYQAASNAEVARPPFAQGSPLSRFDDIPKKSARKQPLANSRFWPITDTNLLDLDDGAKWR